MTHIAGWGIYCITNTLTLSEGLVIGVALLTQQKIKLYELHTCS